MYIRFLKKYFSHTKGDILDTSNAAGDIFVQRNIAEEMVEDYMNDDNLITKKEDDLREERQLKEMAKEKEQQDLIDIEDELEKQEIIEVPKRKRGRPRKSPNNKQINTNTINTK